MTALLSNICRRFAWREDGFTLVEQIVTLAIVAMVLTAAMAAIATGGLGLNVATARNEAMTLAQAQMECIKKEPFVTGASAGTYACSITAPKGYSMDTVVYNGADPHVQRVEVTVYRGSNDVLYLEDLKVERP